MTIAANLRAKGSKKDASVVIGGIGTTCPCERAR